MKSKDQTAYDQALREMKKMRPDVAIAKGLLERARMKGDLRASYALGTWYLHGTGVRRNISKAVALLREGARGGVPSASFDLAVCFEQGVGVSINPRSAFRCFLEAALRGDTGALYEVGRCLYYGIGVVRDTRVAWIWLDRSRELAPSPNPIGRKKGGRDSRLRASTRPNASRSSIRSR